VTVWELVETAPSAAEPDSRRSHRVPGDADALRVRRVGSPAPFRRRRAPVSSTTTSSGNTSLRWWGRGAADRRTVIPGVSMGTRNSVMPSCSSPRTDPRREPHHCAMPRMTSDLLTADPPAAVDRRRCGAERREVRAASGCQPGTDHPRRRWRQVPGLCSSARTP
jgi:hypothetical protein